MATSATATTPLGDRDRKVESSETTAPTNYNGNSINDDDDDDDDDDDGTLFGIITG